MAFDAKQLMQDNLAALEPLLKAAYDKGAEDARNAILLAAGVPAVTGRPAPPSLITGSGAKPTDHPKKAPRGTVPKVLRRMLTDHPGKQIVDYEDMFTEYDDRISVRSIGNELRRMEDKKYCRNDDGEWFLMTGNKEAEDAASNEQSSASDHTNQGDRYGTALDL